MKAEMDMPALLGVACIMAMVALHVWGSAGVRTYIVLIVLAAGSVAAFALGLVRDVRRSASRLPACFAFPCRARDGRHLRST